MIRIDHRERAVPAFVHGASVMLCVFMLAAVGMGPAEFADTLVPDWAPGWLVIVVCSWGLWWTYRDMKKPQEEHTVIRNLCAKCDPDDTRGAF